MEQLTKRILALGAALVLALGLCACGGSPESAAPRVDSGDSAVIDGAGVLSQDTENYVTNLSAALQEGCGAQIGVYTVDYIGNTTMEEYAYTVANGWALGDAQKKNGILLLLAVGEDDYWAMCGAGLETQLSAATLDSLLHRELEPSWLEGDYDTGTRNTVAALAEELCGIYGLTMDIDAVAAGGTAAAPAQPARQESGGGFITVLLIILAIVVVLIILGQIRRAPRNPPPPPPPPGAYGGYGGGYYTAPRRSSGFGSGFASGLGFGVGQSVGRRMFGGGTRRQSPPPPPPPHAGGRSGGFSAPSRPSAPRSGGFSGAGRRTGGSIGRSGGSFRAGGGSFRGGGAGRRK